jgi:hypothetical protein
MSDEVKKTPRTMVAVVGGIVIIAAAVVAIILLGGRNSSTTNGESSSAKLGHVKIEFRAMPPSTITLDGHEIGKTPLTVTVPTKSTPSTAAARSKITRYGRAGKQVIAVGQTLQLVPDHDQTVDFNKLKPLEEQPLPDDTDSSAPAPHAPVPAGEPK